MTCPDCGRQRGLGSCDPYRPTICPRCDTAAQDGCPDDCPMWGEPGNEPHHAGDDWADRPSPITNPEYWAE